MSDIIVPSELRSLISEYIAVEDIEDQDLYIDTEILNRFRKLGLNPLLVLKEKEQELSEISRIKKEEVIPLILEYCEDGDFSCDWNYGPRFLCLSNIDEFISKMGKVGWIVKQDIYDGNYVYLTPHSDSKHKTNKLWDDLRKWDMYTRRNKTPLYDVIQGCFNTK